MTSGLTSRQLALVASTVALSGDGMCVQAQQLLMIADRLFEAAARLRTGKGVSAAQ